MINLIILYFSLVSLIIAQPTIDLIEPAFGGIGSTITISGENFSSNSIENTVFFSGLESNILNATENELMVSVPYGAYYTPISVYANGLYAASSQRFDVTFDAAEELQASHLSIQLDNPYLGTKYYSIKIADMNGDEVPEIVTSQAGSGSLAFVTIYTTSFDDDGMISIEESIALNFGTGVYSMPRDIALGDLNGDGIVYILDVVIIVNLVLLGENDTCIDIDGNIYETVQIGEQLWMAENLKVTHYNNGDEIPYIYNDPQYGAYINYSNNADNVAVYGRLYNWFAVNDERGLCPDYWHVPSDDEFKSLEMYLGMSESEANGEGLRGTDEGGKLKEEGNEHWNRPNTGATNETDFTALPGGNRRYETYTNQEIFSGLNRYGFFWSSSEVYTVNAWYRVLSYDYSESNRYHLSKANAFSVRCVED